MQNEGAVFCMGIVSNDIYNNELYFGEGGSVHRLLIDVDAISCDDSPMNTILPGQFFMLRRKNSKHVLGRPISLYNLRNHSKTTQLWFLILEKGEGTNELCHLPAGTEVEVLGPLGNGYPLPEKNEKVALVGGGIGVASVAGLAHVITPKSYDFYACYKDGTYGLEYLSARNVVIATENGSVGKKGMLPKIFKPKTIAEENYTKVYACGPKPMLAYIKAICDEVKVKCYLSLENYMACGVGACLGCTIYTKDGNKKCCKDGPVFDGDEIVFEKPKITAFVKTKGDFKVDLAVDVAGVHFKNPVIAASGTFGFGEEYFTLADVPKLGGIVSKGITLEPRTGNTGRRVLEVPGGMMNSIGLENPGVPSFCLNEFPRMMKLGPTVIANLSGKSIETYVQGAELLDKTNVPMIELNISCPNVENGKIPFGLDPMAAYNVTEAVRAVTMKPLMVKLSPNAPDIISVANAVRIAGADAISLVNTFQALAIDIETGLPVFENTFAGLSGPGIKPLALRIVYQIAMEMEKIPENDRVPIVGLGGISTWQDAVEFILAGCSAVQVGTATFNNPRAMIEIIEGIKGYMKTHGFKKIEDFRGLALTP